VLVDADNVFPGRLQPILDVLERTERGYRLTAAGHERALARLSWPQTTDTHAITLIPAQGWQSADLALAEAYVPDADPLLLVTGDGDFGLMATRHAGPLLVISGSPSSRLRDVAPVLDPALDGTAPLVRWLAAA